MSPIESFIDEKRIEYLQEQYRRAPKGTRTAAYARLKNETTRQLAATAAERVIGRRAAG